MSTKQAIVDALTTLVNSRPGFEPGNYGDGASYRADVRRATRQRADALRLLRDIELRDSITAEMILDAAKGGRITLKRVSQEYESRPVGLGWKAHYTAGQYYCTEYRAAVARLAAQVLWAWKRDQCMPAPDSFGTYLWRGNGKSPDALSAGDWLRASFCREYGRGMAARYFS